MRGFAESLRLAIVAGLNALSVPNAHAIATLLESELFGLVTWGEAWPHPDSPWTRRGFAIVDSTYLRWRDDPKIRSVLAPRNEITGECIHLIENGSPDRAKQILREGDTAAIAMNHLIELGVSREQVLGPGS